ASSGRQSHQGDKSSRANESHAIAAPSTKTSKRQFPMVRCSLSSLAAPARRASRRREYVVEGSSGPSLSFPWFEWSTQGRLFQVWSSAFRLQLKVRVRMRAKDGQMTSPYGVRRLVAAFLLTPSTIAATSRQVAALQKSCDCPSSPDQSG